MASGTGGQTMPKAKRERRDRTDNYHLIQQWCRTPEQRLYEGIRLVVLFGQADEMLWRLATKLPDYAQRKRQPGPPDALQDLMIFPPEEIISS
jgi:hypothetical protein